MRKKNNTNLERMRELIERLTETDIAYYKNDAPIMTDLEYDRLTEELASLEHDTGLVLSGSPTQKVSGEILESLAEVRHTKPMLSAGKTKSIEDLIRFAAGRAVLLTWKMDGLTLVLRYEYGKLKQAIQTDDYSMKRRSKMDQRLQHIVEHYDEMCIGTDEHFRFHCKQCGKCCINREDILLNPKDLYNISKELGLAPRDTIAQYCEVYLGQNSRIPIVRLKPRGSIKRCPLLRDRKCSVHNAKPTVCALFPLGRSIKLDAKETDPNAIERARIQYIINSIECGDRSEEHTVREWVESFGIPIHDNDFIAWQKALFSVRQQIVELEKMLPDKSMERVWSITYQALYLNYDIQEDFREQFQKNSDRLIDALEHLPALWKELSHE